MRIELGPGIFTLVGPNGAGKTNLLEALYFALTGRSFRTADRRDLIPFGGRWRAPRRRSATTTARALPARLGQPHRGPPPPPRRQPADPATLARHRPPVAVFSPDRLALVKGPPAERRAHLDRLRRGPLAVRAELRSATGRPSRSATLCSPASRPGCGPGELDVVGRRPGGGAAALVAARAEAVEELARRSPRPPPSSASRARRRLDTRRGPTGSAAEIAGRLAERREADLRLGRTSWGPHLDELKLALAGRSCAATAPRASSAPPCSPSSSRSARRSCGAGRTPRCSFSMTS